MIEKTESLKKIKSDLFDLVRLCEESKLNQKILEEKMELTLIQLKRAQKLLIKLTIESERWSNTHKNLIDKINNL